MAASGYQIQVAKVGFTLDCLQVEGVEIGAVIERGRFYDSTDPDPAIGADFNEIAYSMGCNPDMVEGRYMGVEIGVDNHPDYIVIFTVK